MSDNLNPQQFNDMHSSYLGAFNGRREFKMMRPSELLPHVVPTPDQEEADAEIGGRIQRQGYRGKGLGIKEHIHLVEGEFGGLANGNHRVRAMNQIGYDKPVPVLVSHEHDPKYKQWNDPWSK